MSHRILLAGPKTQQINNYAAYLSQLGYIVRTTSTGLGCLTILRNWYPDLMVMNPDMYWGSGMGVLGVMYEESSISVIPVLLLADDSARVKTEVQPEWPCHLLQNSISPFQLSEIVEEFLHQSELIEI